MRNIKKQKRKLLRFQARKSFCSLAVFALLFLFSISLMAKENKYLEETRISVKLTNSTIGKVLNEIEKNTEFSIIYNTNDINLEEKVNINVQNQTADKILTELFAGKEVSFDIKEKHIIIYKNDKKEVAKTAITADGVKQAGKTTITGIVVDDDNLPIIGASVIEEGTSNGSITDMDGNFTVKTSDEAKKIVISYIGFTPKTVSIDKKKDLGRIILQEDDIMLNQVIVVGYGVQKKENLTGAVTAIKMSDAIGNRPITDVQSALVGATPGLNVSGFSGEPGSAMSLNIRGTTSINGGGPLILLDNMPIDNLLLVNPNDIESISVLKDAASSAIYGARAAYGVVLITSKQGTRNKKSSFNYSNNLTFNAPTNLAKKASPIQTVQAYKDFGYKDYWDGRNIDTWLGLLTDYNQDRSLYPDGRALVNGMYYSLKENDLWEDMMEDRGYAFSQSHNISASGGSDNMNYRLSVGLVDQDGILHTDKDSYKRYNVGSFVSSNVTSWLNLSLDASFANSSKSDPYALNFNGYGLWAAAASFPSYHPVGGMDFNDEYLLFATPRNILNSVDPNKTKRKNTRLMGRFTITPTKGLSIVGELGYNKTDEYTNSYNKIVDGFILGQEYAKTQSTNTSSYSKSTYEKTHHLINLFATYNKTFSAKHNFTGMVGFNQENDIQRNFNAKRENMIIPDLPSIGLGSGIITATNTTPAYAVRGVFGRLNYDYEGRYLIEVNGRYDGSSRFPKNDRFGFFPSVSAGWRISEEAFMKSTKSVLSNLKLRASFGSIGNQSLNDNYGYFSTMEPNLKGEWMVDGESVVTLNTPKLVRKSFTWEKAETTNVGVDFGLFNKVNATFDYYQRRTKGMLGPSASLPNILGAPAPQANASDLKTSGWELEIAYNDKFGDVKVRGAFNISDDKSKITKYKNDTKSLDSDKDKDKRSYYVGQNIGEIWGYVTDRYYTVDDFVEGTLTTTNQGVLTGGTLKPGIAHIEGVKPNPGDVLYKDFDKNGIINEGLDTKDKPGDRKVIGNEKPRFRYGFSLGATWKNFDLSVFFQGVGKRDYWLSDNIRFPFPQVWSTIYSHQLNYWTPENTNSEYPRIYEGAGVNTGNNRKIQTGYLSDLSYLRLKNLTITYNVPTKLLSKIHFNSAKIFVSGEDLYTWDNLSKGADPEMSTGGRGYGAIYPMMRKFSFGVNVSF